MRDVHPIADLFPLLEGKEFDELVADIRANKLQQPITIDTDGRIIDGRNRARACEAIGIEPEAVTWNGGGTVEAFVISMNIRRRHLSTTERALLAVHLTNTTRGGDRKSPETKESRDTLISVDDAAALCEVSPASIKRLHTVLTRGDDETIAAVKSGALAIVPAVRRVRERERAKKAKKAKPPIGVGDDEAWRAILAALLKELQRRRAENHDRRTASRWSPRDIIKAEQTAILNWIEIQIEHLSSGRRHNVEQSQDASTA